MRNLKEGCGAGGSRGFAPQPCQPRTVGVHQGRTSRLWGGRQLRGPLHRAPPRPCPDTPRFPRSVPILCSLALRHLRRRLPLQRGGGASASGCQGRAGASPQPLCPGRRGGCKRPAQSPEHGSGCPVGLTRAAPPSLLCRHSSSRGPGCTPHSHAHPLHPGQRQALLQWDPLPTACGRRRRPATSAGAKGGVRPCGWAPR